MTKKHIKAIAAIINKNVNRKMTAPNGEYETVMQLMHDIAEYMKDENPRFDEARFYGACGKAEK